MSSAEDSLETTSATDPFEDADRHPVRFLFAVDGDHPTEVLRIVCDLAGEADAELLLAAPVTLPEQTPLTSSEPQSAGHRSVAKVALAASEVCDGDRPIEQVVRVGHDRDAILRSLVDRHDVSTFVAEDEPTSGLPAFLGIPTGPHLTLASACNTIVVTGIRQLTSIESILVPISRGPHSGFAIDTGLALARQHDATLELLHVAGADDDESRERGEDVLSAGMERIGEYGRAERALCHSRDVVQTILEHAAPADVTVMGAPRRGRLRQFVFGTVPDEVTARTAETVLTTHRRTPDQSWLDRWF